MSLSVHNDTAAPTRALEVRAGDVIFRLAEPSDDDAIRALLRGHSMAGGVRLRVETEPSFLRAAALLGERVEVIVGRRAGESRAVGVGGLGVRAVRRVWLNGAVREIGHLSFLRVDPEFRRRRDFLRGGYELLRLLHERDPVVCHLTAILRDNVAARRVLEAGHRAMPQYAALADVITFTLRSSAKNATAAEMVRPEEQEELSQFLTGSLARQPFAPVKNGPPLENFAMMCRAGAIAGAAALWDQRSVRQWIVAGYSGTAARWRPLYNALYFLHGRPRLPAPGHALNLAYISRLAVHQNHPDVLLPLLTALRREARRRGIDYLALSLAATHPACAAVAKLADHQTHSLLYRVTWPGDPPSAAITGIPYVEAALL